MRVLFIGTQFSNLYTAVDAPAVRVMEKDMHWVLFRLLNRASA
jgi:hypothetical protein